MQGYSQELAERYSSLRDNYTASDARVFEILKDVDIGMKDVLDFGCGDGRYAFHFGEDGAKSVMGIDNSATMIQIAKDRLSELKNPTVKFIECGGTELPLSSESVDIVFANFVLHHFQDTHRPLREIARTLRKQGYLLATFNTTSVKDPSLFNTEIPLRLGTKETFVTVRNLLKSDDEIMNGLRKAGLEVQLYEEVSNPSLHIDPGYPDIKSVQRMKTMLCLAKKE